MSDSRQQRRFISSLLKVLKENGIEAAVESSKKYKLKIADDNSVASVTISKTPTNRCTAQKAALGDIKRALESIGKDPSFLNDQSLAHFITNTESDDYDDRNSFDKLAKSLKDEGIPIEDISDIISAVQSALSKRIDPHEEKASSSTLRPTSVSRSQKLSCNPIVTALCTENGRNVSGRRYFTLSSGISALLNYYIHCSPITRYGIIITNVWRPSNITPFEIPINIFESKGTKTIFILKSGNSLTLIPPP